MRLDNLIDLFLKYCDSDLALLSVWGCEHRVVGVGVKRTESPWVITSVDGVD